MKSLLQRRRQSASKRLPSIYCAMPSLDNLHTCANCKETIPNCTNRDTDIWFYCVSCAVDQEIPIYENNLIRDCNLCCDLCCLNTMCIMSNRPLHQYCSYNSFIRWDLPKFVIDAVRINSPQIPFIPNGETWQEHSAKCYTPETRVAHWRNMVVSITSSNFMENVGREIDKIETALVPTPHSFCGDSRCYLCTHSYVSIPTDLAVYLPPTTEKPAINAGLLLAAHFLSNQVNIIPREGFVDQFGISLSLGFLQW